MILVCEPLCLDSEHAPFNAGLLATICAAYPAELVRFVAEAGHIARVREQLPQTLQTGTEQTGNQKLQFQAVAIPPRRTSQKERRPLERSLLAEITQGLTAQDRLVLASTTESTLAAIDGLRPKALRQRSQAVIHGNLSDIAGWRSRNPFQRRHDLHSSLRRAVKQGVQVLVLEKAIALHATELVPDLAPGLAVLEHPLIASDAVVAPSKQPPVRIAFMGMAAKEKGFDVFADAAAQVKEAVPEGIEFHAHGPLPPGHKPLDWPGLNTPPMQEWLTCEEYQQGIQGSHYVAMPYDAKHYRWSASGVLLDAIHYSRPVICLDNPVVRQLFNEHGDFGYLCADQEDWVNTCIELAKQPDVGRYTAQCHTLDALKTSRTPESLAQQYLAACQLQEQQTEDHH